MGIGAIGAVSYRPYVYNTNKVTSASLERVKPVDDDVTEASTDYSALTDEDMNVNPLKKGETSNFSDILESQMAMSRQNAARVLMPSEGSFI